MHWIKLIKRIVADPLCRSVVLDDEACSPVEVSIHRDEDEGTYIAYVGPLAFIAAGGME